MTRGPRPSMAWAAGTLRLCEMPPEEVRAVLTADDPEIVRRFLELHMERLEEGFAERRRTLASLGRSLTEEILERERLRTGLSMPSPPESPGLLHRRCNTTHRAQVGPEAKEDHEQRSISVR